MSTEMAKFFLLGMWFGFVKLVDKIGNSIILLIYANVVMIKWRCDAGYS